MCVVRFRILDFKWSSNNDCFGGLEIASSCGLQELDYFVMLMAWGFRGLVFYVLWFALIEGVRVGCTLK